GDCCRPAHERRQATDRAVRASTVTVFGEGEKRKRKEPTMRFLLVALLAAGLAIGVASAHASSAVTPTTGDPNALLVVPRGQPIQIAFADSLTGSTSSYAASLADAVDMAVEAHPKIHGFPIQVNLIDAPCGDAAADVAAAKTIVANRQNAAVLGQV